jgi:hypothetical protein
MMKWKGIGRNWLWPNFKVLSWHSLEELRKTTKNLSQDSQYQGRYFKLGPSECEVRVLTTQP